MVSCSCYCWFQKNYHEKCSIPYPEWKINLYPFKWGTELMYAWGFNCCLTNQKRAQEFPFIQTNLCQDGFTKSPNSAVLAMKYIACRYFTTCLGFDRVLVTQFKCSCWLGSDSVNNCQEVKVGVDWCQQDIKKQTIINHFWIPTYWLLCVHHLIELEARKL